MKFLRNSWTKILICIAMLGAVIWFLVCYDNIREEKFKAMHECMNKTEYDKDSFDRCADEIGYD